MTDAVDLTPAMRHVVLRCSEFEDWTAERQRGFARDWCDIVSGYRGATHRGTIGALVKRGLLVEAERGRFALTRDGLAVRWSL